MKRGRVSIGVVGVLATVGAVLVPLAVPAGAVSQPEVVAQGLNDPYKLTFGPDGALYVAEAGTGGTGPCVDPPAGPDGDPGEICFGASGSVSRVVAGGASTRVVTGLPSIAGEDEVVGPTDVAVAADGALLVSIGLGGNVNTRAAFGAGGQQLGTVLRAVPGSGTHTVFADIAAFEAANDPDAAQPGAEAVGEGGDSNPFGIELVGDDLYVADAGVNAILRVRGGQTSVVSLLPFGTTAAPPFLGLPPGTMIPYQPVPTAVEQAGGGNLAVTQLTGFPFPAGAANVFTVSPAGGAPVVAASGLTHLMDIAIAPDGTRYVAELSQQSLLAGDPNPRIVQLRPDGTRKTLLNAADLRGAPTGLAIGPDGMLYISLGLAGPGNGRVVRVNPQTASDTAAAAACPPVQVPGTAFTDIASSVHRESVECLAWWGIVRGVSASSFAPGTTATRGAVASMLASLLREAGVQMATNPPDAFRDDAGSPHEANINQLAARGVLTGFGDGTVRPNEMLTRAQLASMLVRAYEQVFGDLPTAPDAFADDTASVHQANINTAAAAGWVRGTSATTFSPGAGAQRAQVSSIMARMLATLVSQGRASLPTPTS